MTNLKIMIKPIKEFGTRNDTAIHTLYTNYSDLLRKIEDARYKMFDLIVVYTDKDFRKMSNIFSNMSTWNRLRRDFGDVHCQELLDYTNVSIGQGFKIYL